MELAARLPEVHRAQTDRAYKLDHDPGSDHGDQVCTGDENSVPAR